MADKEFTDSVEATEHMEEIVALLTDERFTHWTEITDTNFGTCTTAHLQKARQAYGELMNAMYGAGEQNGS